MSLLHTSNNEKIKIKIKKTTTRKEKTNSLEEL